MEEAIMRAVNAFALPEGEIRIEAHGNGHINRTYKVTVEGDRQQYIL